jgi:pimeloyl-ACP methyl ester carboxylesterase
MNLPSFFVLDRLKTLPSLVVRMALGMLLLCGAGLRAETVSYPLNVAPGWNLLGNSLADTLDVKVLFGAQSAITSVWRWNAAAKAWEFYSPTLDADGSLASYAKSQGYGVLTALKPGDGYWVNAKSAVSLGMQSGHGFSLSNSNLSTGWNLVATAEKLTPYKLNASLGSVTSQWTWDAVGRNWVFYASALDAQGSLARYVADAGYQDFGSRTTQSGIGYWVNYAGVPQDPIATTIGPGELRNVTLVKEVSLDALTSVVRAAGGAWSAVVPKYAVTSYRLEYLTLDARGQQVLASALVNVPDKPVGVGSPVLSYQHGTMTKDAEAPTSNAGATEVSVLLASKGYIVLAPDYVGYGVSKGQAHPYLLSAPSASVVNDLLTAAKYWRQTRGVRDNRQLFLVGYSEGGYVTMASARSMETEGSMHQQNLVAIIGGAGPYHVGVTLDEILKRVRSQNALLGALINPGFLRFMGAGVRASVRNELEKQFFGSGGDVVFDMTFLDNFLADDAGAMERQSNVHDWKPSKAVKLFHGRDDDVVSYLSSFAALQAMQARGAGSLVTLTDCAAQPASHLGCVQGYFGYTVTVLESLATDL